MFEVSCETFEESCADWVYTAQNFRAIGVQSSKFATVYIGSSISHRGHEANAQAGGRPATVAVMDSGFSTGHKALASAFEAGYDFLMHTDITVSLASEVTARIMASEARLDNPSSGVPNYFFNTVTMHADDATEFIKVFRDIPGSAFEHGTSIAGIIAGQRITTTVTVSVGVAREVETVPGIAPGTKIIPFQVIGALSMNWCTATVTVCTRSRPHLVPEMRSTFKRMNTVVTLAKKDGAFAMNVSLGERALPVSISLVNDIEVTATLVKLSSDDRRTIIQRTTQTYAVGSLTVAVDEIAMFSPLLLPPAERISLSQAAQNAITSGDGMAIVFAMGNAGYNDENGEFFWRDGFRKKVTVEGVVYDRVDHAPANYVFATDLSVSLSGLPGGEAVDVRNYGFETIVNINGRPVPTRSLSEYIISLWQFPGHESLKPYWLSVVGSRNITLDDGTVTPEIVPFSIGCGKSWERCITAPAEGLFTTHDSLSENNQGYSFSSGTSQAAPHVTGALALLKRYFPDLRADTATEILLATADDLGDPGPDVVYGMGHLNIARALNPVGSLTAVRNGGALLTGSYLRTSGALAGLAATDALVVGYDRYARPFGSPLAEFVEPQPLPAPRTAAGRIMETLQRKRVAAPGGVLHYRGDALERFSWPAGANTFVAHDFCELECGQSGDGWGFMAAGPEIANLTRLRHSLLPGHGIELEASLADGRGTDAAWRSLALRWRHIPAPGFEWGLEIGRAEEGNTLLGSEFGGAFGLADGAATGFVHAAGSWQLAANVFATGSLSRVRTQAVAGADSLIVGLSDLAADAASFGLVARGVLRNSDAVELAWEMPLRVTSGTMHLRAGGYDENGQPLSGTTAVAFGASSRKSAWRLSYAAPLPGLETWLSVGMESRRNLPGPNARRNDLRYSVAFSWKH